MALPAGLSGSCPRPHGPFSMSCRALCGAVVTTVRGVSRWGRGGVAEWRSGAVWPRLAGREEDTTSPAAC